MSMSSSSRMTRCGNYNPSPRAPNHTERPFELPLTIQQIRQKLPEGSICEEYLGYVYIVKQECNRIVWSIPFAGHGGYHSKGGWAVDLDCKPYPSIKELMDQAERSVKIFIDKMVAADAFILKTCIEESEQ